MFSHSDSFFTITPEEGPNQGKPFRIKSGTKVAFDPGGKAGYMKGFEQVPIAIVRQSAEPKLDVDCSNAKEVWDARNWVQGIGGSAFTVTHVFQRPGLPTQTFSFTGCQWETGGGFDTDDSNGAQSKMAFKLMDALHNGLSIYNRRFAP